MYYILYCIRKWTSSEPWPSQEKYIYTEHHCWTRQLPRSPASWLTHREYTNHQMSQRWWTTTRVSWINWETYCEVQIWFGPQLSSSSSSSLILSLISSVLLLLLLLPLSASLFIYLLPPAFFLPSLIFPRPLIHFMLMTSLFVGFMEFLSYSFLLFFPSLSTLSCIHLVILRLNDFREIVICKSCNYLVASTARLFTMK